MHAECLALMAGMEEASHIQTWLFELQFPRSTTLELINAPASQLVQIRGVTDCYDLLEVLIKSAVSGVTNRSLSLYIACLREMKETHRVESWSWVDTRDNVANGLTKLSDDGTLPMEPINVMMREGFWEPVIPYHWQGVLTDCSDVKSDI